MPVPDEITRRDQPGHPRPDDRDIDHDPSPSSTNLTDTMCVPRGLLHPNTARSSSREEALRLIAAVFAGLG